MINIGGASDKELESALFVYRKPTVGEIKQNNDALSSVPSIMQIDLVPTLSIALGIPIPYSSLGVMSVPLLKIMLNIDNNNLLEYSFITKSLYRNAMQVLNLHH